MFSVHCCHLEVSTIQIVYCFNYFPIFVVVRNTIMLRQIYALYMGPTTTTVFQKLPPMLTEKNDINYSKYLFWL